MTESKHVLTSKIFMGGAIGLLANLITSLARHYGYDVVISSEIQLHLNTVILGLIAYWRNRPTKQLHVKKPKVPKVVESRYTYEEAQKLLNKSCRSLSEQRFTDASSGTITYAGKDGVTVNGKDYKDGDFIE